MVTEADKEAACNEKLDFIDDLDNEGLTSEYLAKKLKKELNAKETKAQIPKGEKEFSYSKRMIAWDIRQKARQDAHKLRGDYPAEKVEHSGSIVYESNIPEPDPLPEDKKDA